jgi:hypothetical protein
MSSSPAKIPANIEIVQPDDNPPASPVKKRKSKKILLIVLILLLLLGGGYLGGSYFLGRSAWNSFAAVLDHAFGKDNWKAEGSGYSLMSRTFTVKGLNVSLPERAEPWENPKGGYEISLGSLSMKGVASDAASLLEKESWAGGSGVKLAGKIDLSELSVQKTLRNLKSTYRAESLSVSDLSLASGPNDLPSGLPGYLKSLVLGELTAINFSRVKDPSPDATDTLSLGFEKLTLIRPVQGQDLKNPYDPLDVFLNLTADELRLNGLSLGASTLGAEYLNLNLDELRMTGLAQRAKCASFLNRNLGMLVSDPSDANRKVSFSIGRVEMHGADLSLPLDRIKWVIDRVSTDYYFPSPERIFEDFLRISDMATIPVSLSSAKISDLKLEAGQNGGFSISEINLTGPFERSVLPTGTIVVSEITVEPTSVPGPDGRPLSLYRNFLNHIGENSFVMDLSLAFNSDPAKGSLKVNLSQLNIRNLGSFSGALSISGLTQNLINAMAQLSARYVNNLSFGDGLNNTGLDSLSLVFKDDSLTSKFISFSASLNNLSSPDMIAVFKSRISDAIISKTGSYLDSASDLSDLAGDFISSPDVLSFSLSPSRPFTHALIETYQNDKAGLYNHLNMTATANELPPVVFAFNENINPAPEEPPAQTESQVSIAPETTESSEGASGSDAEPQEDSEAEAKE